MKKFEKFLSEEKEKRKHVRNAKVGDILRVGQKGTDFHHLVPVKKITPTGRVKAPRPGHSFDYDFDPKTGFHRGAQKDQTIFAQVATHKDLEKDYRARAIKHLRQHNYEKHSTEDINTVLKHLNVEISSHFKPAT